MLLRRRIAYRGVSSTYAASLSSVKTWCGRESDFPGLRKHATYGRRAADVTLIPWGNSMPLCSSRHRVNRCTSRKVFHVPLLHRSEDITYVLKSNIPYVEHPLDLVNTFSLNAFAAAENFRSRSAGAADTENTIRVIGIHSALGVSCVDSLNRSAMLIMITAVVLDHLLHRE